MKKGTLRILNSKPCYTFNCDPKMFKPFLNDAKLTKVDYRFWFIIYVKYLRSYLQKTWRGGLTNLKFCVLANQLVPKKSRKLHFCQRPPSWGKYRTNIFFTIFIWKYVLKYLQSLLRDTFNWSSKSIKVSNLSLFFKINSYQIYEWKWNWPNCFPQIFQNWQLKMGVEVLILQNS